MVPSGWAYGRIDSFFVLQRGYDLTKKQRIDGTIPVVSSSGIAYYHNVAKVTGPGVVTGRKGSVGTVHLIEEDFWPHDTTLWIKDFKGNSVKYVKYYLDSMDLEKYDESSSVPTLNRNNVHRVKTAFPSIQEQQKIVEILSTWDKTISTTERLIDNSKQQKKALMQQLLTGKKRLLDDEGVRFEGEWEEVKLDEVVLNTQLGTTERTKDSIECDTIPLLKMGNLTWGGFNFNKLETIPISKIDSSLILKDGDFLFNTRNTRELVGKSAVWKGQMKKVTFDNNLNRLAFNHKVNSEFLCMYLTHGKGKSTINSLPAGSTSVAAIYWKDLKNIKMLLPLIKEQLKILAVLTNADKEIELLEQQLGDLKQEKKSLMQQLLTGKRRVIVDECEVA